MRSWYRDTVTRVRIPQASTDAWGNPTPGTPQSVSVGGCRVQPMSVEERQMADQNMSEVEVRLFAPVGADILVTDFVDWQSKRYKVHGEPELVRSPYGGADHVRIGLVRIDG